MLNVGQLAGGTKVGAALADENPLDPGLAAATRLVDLAVDPEVILIPALRVNPVNGRAAVFEAISEGGSNGPAQRGNLCVLQGVGPAQGMNPGPPQGFVGVDIADPGDKRLVEQEGLEAAGFLGQQASQDLQREALFQRLGAEMTGDGVEVVNQVHPAEFTRVVEAQLIAVVQAEGEMDVFFARKVSVEDVQTAAHFQMDEQVTCRGRGMQAEDQILAAAPDRVDAMAGQGVDQRVRRRPGGARPVQPHGRDRAAERSRVGWKARLDRLALAQFAGNGFDFWQFRHRRRGL